MKGEVMSMNRTSETGSVAGQIFQTEYGHFIGGDWVGGDGGETIEMRNPATGGLLSRIQSGTASDVERAVEAARAAFPKWSRSPLQDRQQLLMQMAQRLMARLPDYAMMETLDNGKPISESQTFDVPLAAGMFAYYAGVVFSLHGETLDYPNAICLVHREPIGVCAQIIPWNVPLVMMATKLAPALAAGNTVVLKPSEICCLSVLEFIRDIADILPPGVVNVVTGYGSQVGEPLVTHPQVRKVAFTGSPATARKIMNYASVNIIPQTLELGGKSAQIVCEDADLDAAAEAAAICTVFNKGEVCLSGSRVLAHHRVHDEFVERFSRILKTIRIGDPTDPTTQLGPQASQAQLDKICRYLELGRQEGAEVVAGGRRAEAGSLADGFFMQPTIFSGVSNTMKIARDEIFGPVMCVMPWKDEEEALRIANDSHYGLAGGLWTRDLARAHRMSRALEAGTIWVNRYYNFVPGAPIGGVKGSGFGREACMETLNHYTQLKSVVINLDEGPLGAFGQ